MKYLVPFIVVLLIMYSCSTNQVNLADTSATNKMSFEPNEGGEYDIIVFDPQYETYLRSFAQPKSYYSYEYYRIKNRFYVTIWNQRHAMPTIYNPDLYAVNIDLDNSIDYGLDFEYKLYNFFKFIEWKYRVRIR